jgi:isoleucyl-tRNA synthetase
LPDGDDDAGDGDTPLLLLLLQFRRVFQACLNFVSGELSSFYLDTAKDRMYIQGNASSSRRACQTVQSTVLRVGCKLIAHFHLNDSDWVICRVKGSTNDAMMPTSHQQPD